MRINTKFHGQIVIDTHAIIYFPNGIPGFEDEKEFIIIDLIESGNYKVLQSIKNQWVAFIMIDPWVFKEDYEFDLPESVLEQLEVTSEAGVEVYNLLTIPQDLQKSTMNLIAPIIIQQHKKLGMQVVLENVAYSTKYPIGIEGS